MKITEKVFEEYLSCKYKSYLMINNDFEKPTGYESLLANQQQEYVNAASCAILGLPEKSVSYEKTCIDRETLKQGLPIIFGPHFTDESIDFSFDALQKVTGTSSLGAFHYIPVIFCGETFREVHKLLLSVGAFILETLQGLRPPKGIAISGYNYRRRNVDLDSQQHRTQAILKDLKQYIAPETEPRLRLNDHCRICR